jgi:hypothetical protein
MNTNKEDGVMSNLGDRIRAAVDAAPDTYSASKREACIRVATIADAHPTVTTVLALGCVRPKITGLTLADREIAETRLIAANV